MNVYDEIKQIVKFTSRIWYIHPFMEGNTRTTCVFIEKYLKSLGFSIDNGFFKENAEYFRNALVRANYENSELHIEKDIWPLTKFFIKMLYDETIEIEDSDVFMPELFKNKVKIRRRDK